MARKAMASITKLIMKGPSEDISLSNAYYWGCKKNHAPIGLLFNHAKFGMNGVMHNL